MSSENGESKTSESLSRSASNRSSRPRKLMPHFERMISFLQVNLHTNKFHTEHEDYIFTGPALTSMIESYMDRPAVVVAQPKIRPDEPTPTPAEDTKARPRDREEADEPEEEQTINQAQAEVATSAPEPGRRVADAEHSEQNHDAGVPARPAKKRLLEDNHGEVAWIPPAIDRNRSDNLSQRRNRLKRTFIESEQDGLPDDIWMSDANEYDTPFIDDPLVTPEAATRPVAHAQNIVRQLLNTSVSSTRTDTSKTDLVITDYMVLALKDPDAELDSELVSEACATVRNDKTVAGDDHRGLPDNHVPRYYADTQDSDSEDDRKKSEDTSYRPSGRRAPKLRDYDDGFRATTLQSRSSPPPPPPPPSTENLDISELDGRPLERLSWLEQELNDIGMDTTEPGDNVCNTKAAFKCLKDYAQFVVAMLIECKQSVSRQDEGEAFVKSKFTRLREAQRQLMIQAAYLLTSDTWKDQTNVVAMAMIGDWWSWTEFEKRIGFDKQANWEDYTYENRPIKTCQPWSQLVQWGSAASDRAMQKMMQRVNELFPGSGVALPSNLPSTSTSTSHPGSPEGPDGEAPLPEAPDSADPNAPSKNRVQLVALDPMSADYLDGADPGDDDEARSGDGEDHGEDDADSSEGAGEVFSSEREVSHHDDEEQHAPVVAVTSDPEARSLDPDVTMDEPRRTPSGGASSGATSVSRAPASHLSWRDLQRYDSEDSLKADDTQLPLIARADAVDADGSVTRRLHGEKTQATFDVFSNMRLGDGTGHDGATSTEPPDGSSTQKHAQDVPTLPAPGRGYGDPPERTQATSGSNRQRDTASEHTHAIDETVNTTECGSFAPSSAPEGAPAASVVPLGPRMQYRQLPSLRTDTQDTEFTLESGHLAHPAENDDNDANEDPTDRPGGTALTGHATQATLDALAAISMSHDESAGHSASAPVGDNGPIDASIAAATAVNAQGGGGGGGGGSGGGGGGATGGHVPINPDNPLKRSAIDDSDDEERAGDAHVSKKAKRAPANTEPSAQAGPGSSTQAARGQAASTRGKRKMLVMPPSTRTLRSHDKTKKAPKKG